jgi:hypothetical protein
MQCSLCFVLGGGDRTQSDFFSSDWMRRISLVLPSGGCQRWDNFTEPGVLSEFVRQQQSVTTDLLEVPTAGVWNVKFVLWPLRFCVSVPNFVLLPFSHAGHQRYSMVPAFLGRGNCSHNSQRGFGLFVPQHKLTPVSVFRIFQKKTALLLSRRTFTHTYDYLVCVKTSVSNNIPFGERWSQKRSELATVRSVANAKLCFFFRTTWYPKVGAWWYHHWRNRKHVTKRHIVLLPYPSPTGTTFCTHSYLANYSLAISHTPSVDCLQRLFLSTSYIVTTTNFPSASFTRMLLVQG